MLVKDDIIEDAAGIEHVTNGMRFSVQVLDVDDFGCNIAWCSAAHEQVAVLIRDGANPKSIMMGDLLKMTF